VEAYLQDRRDALRLGKSSPPSPFAVPPPRSAFERVCCLNLPVLATARDRVEGLHYGAFDSMLDAPFTPGILPRFADVDAAGFTTRVHRGETFTIVPVSAILGPVTPGHLATGLVVTRADVAALESDGGPRTTSSASPRRRSCWRPSASRRRPGRVSRRARTPPFGQSRASGVEARCQQVWATLSCYSRC
jgi:hypothetical protein